MKMASAPTPGLIRGNTMSMNVRISPAPSMRAASSISFGMFSENCFIRNTPKGQPTVGKITAHRVLCRFSHAISLSSGIMMTCLGSAMAQTNRLKINPRPAKRFLASA